MRTEEIEMTRQAISITLPKECINWVDEKVSARIYASRSHAIEVLILNEMQKK
jgi:Arc/MetJ-type ribon-helix-helix transcriptional regulator